MSFCHHRRAFLKKSFLTSALLLCGQPAWAGISEPDPATDLLRLYNIHTGEKLAVDLHEILAHKEQTGIDSLNWFLRCHYTNRVHPIDPYTLNYLDVLHQTVGGEREVHIISGYRSPEYNALLCRESGGVARHSLHLEGRALDIRIPGFDLATLRHAALSLHYGGVGYYPASDFVHIDSGRFRQW